MKRGIRILSLFCLSSTLWLAGHAAAAGQEPLAAAAVADATRPDADKARDADRKPAEMLAFAKIQPGQVVVDYFAGRGYFTRLFSTAVGPQGAVYAIAPQALLERLKGKPLPPPVSAEPGRGNVHEAVGAASLNVPVKADVVWTSQNYHDIRIWSGAAGTAELNQAVFGAQTGRLLYSAGPRGPAGTGRGRHGQAAPHRRGAGQAGGAGGRLR